MSFSVVATGDIVLNGPLHRPKEIIYDHVRAADSCIANLEMPFSKNGHPTEKLIALKGDPIHAHNFPRWQLLLYQARGYIE